MLQNSAAMLDKPICIFAHPSKLEIVRARLRDLRIRFVFTGIFAIPLLFLPKALCAQHAKQPPFGIAWRVMGKWHVGGSKHLISEGDAVIPGSLLEPAGNATDHSITLLLPDGQRILYECFNPADCARRFRVPSLYRKPNPVATDLLGRVNEMSHRRSIVGQADRGKEEAPVPWDEAVASIGPGNKIEITGLPGALSNGTYSYVVQPLIPIGEKEPRRDFEKRTQSITLTLPSEGFFEILIVDPLNTPRIDLVVAAVRQPKGARISESFQQVKELLKDWNEDYQGWPVHEIQLDYLRSMMLGIRSSAPGTGTNYFAIKQTRSSDVTAEPKFSPVPGVFKTDTDVTLQSATKDAIIHYTVDGSQPINQSAVYRAPIIVKGTALTIKAFASAKGKKDSPVVTGIFRIGD